MASTSPLATWRGFRKWGLWFSHGGLRSSSPGRVRQLRLEGRWFATSIGFIGGICIGDLFNSSFPWGQHLELLGFCPQEFLTSHPKKRDESNNWYRKYGHQSPNKSPQKLGLFIFQASSEKYQGTRNSSIFPLRPGQARKRCWLQHGGVKKPQMWRSRLRRASWLGMYPRGGSAGKVWGSHYTPLENLTWNPKNWRFGTWFFPLNWMIFGLPS